MKRFAAALAIGLTLLSAFAERAGAVDLVIDCSGRQGRVRPLHGVNCGPAGMGGTVDLSAYYRELGVPLTRLHDCNWPNPDVVDIHAVFPDFRADPALPESYDFRRTDDYLQSIVDTGSGIVYRLGESIEHSKRKYYVHPPADYQKWTEVCTGIMRHYNEGWANGFRYNIRYWEIWAEPDVPAKLLWTGSDEDYYRLYCVASKGIKARCPEVLVGGPSAAHIGNLSDKGYEPRPFIDSFLKHCRREGAPLDFFSWHLYDTDPYKVAQYARGVRRLLDQHGFTKTENHLNEWNYAPGNDWTSLGVAGQGIKRQQWYEEMGGPKGAAYAAANLMLLQDCSVDVANFYRGDAFYFGLFNLYAVPNKPYFAFKAFKSLLDTPLRLPIDGTLPAGVAACAGMNSEQTEVTVLLSNFRGDEAQISLTFTNLSWHNAADCPVFVVDGGRNLERIPADLLQGQRPRLAIRTRAPAVLLVKLRRHE